MCFHVLPKRCLHILPPRSSPSSSHVLFLLHALLLLALAVSLTFIFYTPIDFLPRPYLLLLIFHYSSIPLLIILPLTAYDNFNQNTFQPHDTNDLPLSPPLYPNYNNSHAHDFLPLSHCLINVLNYSTFNILFLSSYSLSTINFNLTLHFSLSLPFVPFLSSHLHAIAIFLNLLRLSFLFLS